MSKLAWDLTGQHFYETGVDRGVLFPYNKSVSSYGTGVAWNGLTGVTESPSGAEGNAIYADNIKYLNLISAEEFGATITAYTYPEEFEPMNGYASIAKGVTIGQQTRGTFGFAYRTLIGNDTEGTDKGYKIKLVYGCQAAPSEQGHSTVNDSPEAIEFSWEVSTTPVSVTGFKPTATVDIDSTKCDPTALAAFENVLYGTDGTVSYNAVSDVVVDTYNEVTPETGANPKSEGWYTRTGEAGAYIYVLTNDETVQAGTTYYSKTAGDNPNAKGWYERSGEAGAYVYTLSVDTTANASKTYYNRVETGGSAPRLPLPDEVASLLGVQG